MATTDLGKWMITNGGDYDPDVTYEKLTMVMYDNSTYITLKTVTGVTPSNDQINYALMARGFDPGVLSSVTAVDTSGALGNAGETVSAQSLVDYLADAVMTKLVEKANISNVQVNDSSKVPSAALAYAMQQQITENEEAITGLNSDTLKFFGSGQIIDAVQYPNLSLLPNGIFLYNGWDEKAYSGDMLPPFKGAWGIWIRKTQYGLATDNNGADVVISENGDIFIKPKSNNDWYYSQNCRKGRDK